MQTVGKETIERMRKLEEEVEEVRLVLGLGFRVLGLGLSSRQELEEAQGGEGRESADASRRRRKERARRLIPQRTARVGAQQQLVSPFAPPRNLKF